MHSLDLDRVLTFSPALRFEVTNEGPVVVIGERRRFMLSDPRVSQIAAFIDGRRTVQDIMAAASDRVSGAETLYVLDLLTKRGHLVLASPEIHPHSAAFWENVGFNAGMVASLLAATPVKITSIGDPALAEPVTEALKQAGMRIDANAAVQVVVTEDYLSEDLASLNRRALRDGARWFLLKTTGTKPLLGPLFAGNAGPCWECLAFWMRNNRPVEELLRRHRRQGVSFGPPSAAIEASVRTAAGLGALALLQALASMDTEAPGALRSQLRALDLASFEITAHAVVKRPQCRACGDPALMRIIGERPVSLRPVKKAHFADGGYRCQTPQETYEELQHHISPITGAVTHVVPVPGRNNGLRAVYASGYLVCPSTGMPDTNVFDKVCAGKGKRPEQAKVSALCEALERWSGVYQGDEARLRASTEELDRAAVRLGDLLNFSETQYGNRKIRNGSQVNFREWVPDPLDDKVAIDWTPAWSLSRNEKRYVPLTYCYSEAPSESGIEFCRPCGNGVAAGTCLEEAILQGLLELVERDAVALWWYNRVSRPGIDLASFRDPYFDELRADYARIGWTLWVLDLSHDLAIPVCVAVAHDPRSDRFAVGFGCHVEPRLAVQRALTELNQLFEPSGTRRAPWDTDRLSSRQYLFPSSDLQLVAADDLSRFAGADLRADIEGCRRRLEDAALELIVVDKTRPDIGLSVVQVVVPGLRHFWPRFGPGRLYEVPARLGWLPEPLAERELNQVPLFV